MPTSNQTAAATTVRNEMAERKWNATDVASAAGVSVDTVRDLVNGRRWPQAATLGKLDAAFGWSPGTLAHVAEHGHAPASTTDVGASADNDSEILMHLPPDALVGLTELEREEITTAGRMAILRALREIRGN